jgi:hypothetical protein
VYSFNEEAGLNGLGAIAMRQKLVKLMSNWLELQDYVVRYSEVTSVPLERPMFIVGPARTDTTALFRMLSQDPATCTPLTWETIQPCPPPSSDRSVRDPRIRESEKMIGGLLHLMPDFNVIHEYDLEVPEECYPLLENTLVSPTFAIYGRGAYDYVVKHNPHMTKDQHRRLKENTFKLMTGS